MLGGLCALTLLRAAAVLGQAWLLAVGIDALRAGADLVQVAGVLAGFLVCFVARQGVLAVQDALLARYAQRRVGELRQALLGRVFREGPVFVGKLGTGTTVTMALEGAEQVETYLRLVLPKIAGVLIVPLALLAFVFPLDWVSGTIMLVVFPFIVFYMVLLGRTAKAEADKQHAQFDRLANHFVDTLRGIETLKLFGRSRAQGREVFESSERLRRATMKTLRTAILSGAVLDLFSTFSLAAVAIMLGFRLVDGSIAFFPALVVLVLVPEYFKPIREYASDYHASLDGKTALAELLDTSKDGGATDLPGEAASAGRSGLSERAASPESDGLSESATLSDPSAPSEPAATSETAAPPEPGPWTDESVLSVREVGYDYGERRALQDVSFSVRGCMKVGIVGASGSGKSTLVNVLSGFARPTEGSLSCDVASPAWRRQLVYIPQSPYIFHASLRDNIAFYAPEASDGDVDRAVRATGLERLVDELPEGLGTPIGEGARQLSGGQAQRIALARAFLDPSRRVMLFDEPTAHLDIETELELKERMLPLMEGRLVFFATHRMHWLRDMDAVCVLEDGRMAEWGAPDELLARDGALSRLAARMKGGFDEGR